MITLLLFCCNNGTEAYLKSTYPSFFRLHLTACRILVPQPGIEPTPPTVEAQNLNHCGSSLSLSLKVYIYSFIFGCVGSSLLCPGFLQLGEQKLFLVAVPGFLILLVSLVAGHGLSACRFQQWQVLGSRARAQ